jgi:thymidylate synthase (FAD)
MNVNLISVSKPVYMDEINTAEELIVYCARVSNPSNQLNTATAPKLLKYCIDHGHWSIFEMADMTVEIKTSRAIAAQILRHKSASFQEFSQRYAAATNFEPIEIRRRAVTNRQSSQEVFNPIIDHGEHDSSMGGPAPIYADDAIEEYLREGKRLYKELLTAGVANECARMVLPLTTETTLYMKNSVRGWIHYFKVRCDEHTQKEHREVAYAIRNLFINEFPVISEALGY